MDTYTELMTLLPHGIPANEDTWCKLRCYIRDHMDDALIWKTNPPTMSDEIAIYYSFGCTVPNDVCKTQEDLQKIWDERDKFLDEFFKKPETR